MIKSYCHGTDLENKIVPYILQGGLHVVNLNPGVSLYFVIRSASSESCTAIMTESCTFLSGKPEMSMDSFTSMRKNTYLLTLQGKTQHRRDHSRLFFSCLFVRKPGKRVDQSEHAIYNSAIQNVNKRLRCIKFGNGPFMMAVNLSLSYSWAKLLYQKWSSINDWTKLINLDFKCTVSPLMKVS